MKTVKLDAGSQVARQGHTSKGDQPKWQVGKTWYKADHMGYEALAEVVVSRMLEKSNLSNFVRYEPVRIELQDRTLPGCASENFRRKNETLIPLERLHRAYTGRGLSEAIGKLSGPEESIRYTVDFVERVTGLADFGGYLRVMLEMDAFFLNEDRHMNNIAVIRNEDTKEFCLCPYFDHGLSLLSDLNDYPLAQDIYQCIDHVRAKPFSLRFDDQMEAAALLYGSQLKFHLTRNELHHMIFDLEGLYDSQVLQRVERVLLEQMRKYGYLF